MENRKKTLRESAALKFLAAMICIISLAVSFFSAIFSVICWQNNVFFESDHETFLNNVIAMFVDDRTTDFCVDITNGIDVGSIDVTKSDGIYTIDRGDVEKVFGRQGYADNVGFIIADADGNTVFSTVEGCDLSTGLPGFERTEIYRDLWVSIPTDDTYLHKSYYSGYSDALSDAVSEYYNLVWAGHSAVSLSGTAEYFDGHSDYVLLMSYDGVNENVMPEYEYYLEYWNGCIDDGEVPIPFDFYTRGDPDISLSQVAPAETAAPPVTEKLSPEDKPRFAVTSVTETYAETEEERAVDHGENPPDVSEYTSGIQSYGMDTPTLMVTYEEQNTENCEFQVVAYIAEDPDSIDEIFYARNSTALIAKYSRFFPIAAVLGVLVFLISAFCLACACGYRYPAEGPKPSWFDMIPFEIFALFGVLLAVLTPDVYYEGAYSLETFANSNVRLFTLATEIAIPFLASVFVTLTLMTLSVRLKTHTFWRSCLCGWAAMILWWLIKKVFGVCKKLIKLLSQLKLVWKTVLAMLGFTFFETVALVFAQDAASYLLVMICLNLLLSIAMAAWALGFTKIRDYTKKIAGGDINARPDREFLFGDLRGMADDLDGVGEGVRRAVDESLRSERLKTELITNVSHDLKTPLTSIVNYIDILSKDEIESEEAKEHIAVIQRQSARMKKLIEDLTEVSKASSGNITPNFERTDVNLLLSQSIAEYAEKFALANLESVVTIPESAITASLDGRLMWRVLDNLLNNICKYSQPGTRVYISVETSEGSDAAAITFKNVSRTALNISPDELTERFVRGDSSRNTEGSGLGLSIAKSLCDIQNVGFKLSIDGDLFKAELKIPLCGDAEILSDAEPQEENPSDGEEVK